ncbi:MAG TPA: GrpB family protein, partial [Acidimicrobiales bacterium]|nr:GrpB family protein [Acidimicrobiales bacterium]
MRIHRFDQEVSLPVDSDGSRFRLGALTGPGTRGRVEIIHMPAGGSIGRHPAPSARMLAVVDGAGWVSGADGSARPIRAGYAAVWDAGEEHGAGSDGGLVAVCVEGSFEVLALLVTTGEPIVVSDPDPAWPTWFARLHDHVWPAVADVALRIDHVGSTSVPGLPAKPVIDMDVVVASEAGVEAAKQRLATLGYRWLGDLGVTGRQAFKPVDAGDLPRHNLYVVVENNKAHLD